jgi:hypothetical protein
MGILISGVLDLEVPTEFPTRAYDSALNRPTVGGLSRSDQRRDRLHVRPAGPADRLHPGGGNSSWEVGPASREAVDEWHWWDPEMGEWRYHPPDARHDIPHWDYNPWDEANQPWLHLYPDEPG